MYHTPIILKRKKGLKIANRYVIKRTFDWISLGDSTDKTIKSIPRACQHKIIYSGDVISQVAVQNVKLGDRLVDNVELYFYKNKLYRIMMYINISFKDYDRRITYSHFNDLFIKNGYKYNYHNYDLRRDYYYDKGVDINHMAMDLSCFGDKHTDLELFNSPLNPEQPQIMLTYYDRDSHYVEDKQKANYISDSIFVQ